MQHSESRPSHEILVDRSSDEPAVGKLWVAFAIGTVGLLLALTYALAQAICTSWLFVS